MLSPALKRAVRPGGAVANTMNADRQILQPGAVVIGDGRIIDIGPQDNILGAYGDIDKVDAKGKAVLPGLVNIHSHTAMSALRGMTEDLGRRARKRVVDNFTWQVVTRKYEDLFAKTMKS